MQRSGTTQWKAALHTFIQLLTCAAAAELASSSDSCSQEGRRQAAVDGQER